MGPKRFQIIEQCATEAINKYIKLLVSDQRYHKTTEDNGYSTPPTP